MNVSLSEVAPEARGLVLAFADDELCIGQNLAWWIAVGPFLEEDLALTSISQDELGHARALYGLLGDDVDALAYGRGAHDYRSAHLTELPCHDWGETLARHFLYDTAETVRWTAVADSSWEDLGSVARRALAEERSHTRHASGLLTRLLRTQSGRSHLLPLFDRFAPMACELFAAPALGTPALGTPALGTAALGAPVGDSGNHEHRDADESLVASGFMNQPRNAQRAQWQAIVDEALATVDHSVAWSTATNATNATDATDAVSAPGRAGERSDHFAALHQEMVAVLSLDPTATW